MPFGRITDAGSFVGHGVASGANREHCPASSAGASVAAHSRMTLVGFVQKRRERRDDLG